MPVDLTIRGARSHRFPKAERLAKRRDFLATQDGGRRQGGRHYLLAMKPRADGVSTCRFGVTVSKKVGNSVVRNRVKRWLREGYRRHKHLLNGGVDLVAIARPSAAQSGYEATCAELTSLIRRLGR